MRRLALALQKGLKRKDVAHSGFGGLAGQYHWHIWAGHSWDAQARVRYQINWGYCNWRHWLRNPAGCAHHHQFVPEICSFIFINVSAYVCVYMCMYLLCSTYTSKSETKLTTQCAAVTIYWFKIKEPEQR